MINIVFLGTPQIAISTLEKLIKIQDIKVLAVVTPPDKPQGRKMIITPPPVKVCAVNNNVPVFQTKSIRKDEELIAKLKQMEPDFFVTFAFGQILSQEVLDIPKIGTINVHASLLPKYRGANPIQHAIVNGDKITGITTMLTSLGLDEGDMLLKKEIEIPDDMTDVDLRGTIEAVSPNLLHETITKLYNNELVPIPQNPHEATYANKFEKTDGFIDFNDTARNIHNKVRGLLSWPTCYFMFKDKKVKLLKTEVLDIKTFAKCGEIIEISKNGISVGTLDSVILIKEIQPESKNKMNAYAWNNSVHLKAGDMIC